MLSVLHDDVHLALRANLHCYLVSDNCCFLLLRPCLHSCCILLSPSWVTSSPSPSVHPSICSSICHSPICPLKLPSTSQQCMDSPHSSPVGLIHKPFTPVGISPRVLHSTVPQQTSLAFCCVSHVGRGSLTSRLKSIRLHSLVASDELLDSYRTVSG